MFRSTFAPSGGACFADLPAVAVADPAPDLLCLVLAPVVDPASELGVLARKGWSACKCNEQNAGEYVG